MGKAFVIVESPAKAKTINKYLGNSYIVKSSIGHIRDLPQSGRKRNNNSRNRIDPDLTPEQKALEKERRKRKTMIRRMGIDPENGWEANYEILEGKEKVLNELKKHAEKADVIYLATDMDREGEAIAWHLVESIGGNREKYKRVIFSEITKKAIKQAFDTPSDINMDRVHAQQARRFLDRVVGFMLSPLLWEKVARGLSAGRVQSVAVRLVIEREKGIHAFIPDEYWEVYAELMSKDKPDKKMFRAKVYKYDGKPFKPTNQTAADKAFKDLNNAQYKIIKREDKPTRKKPNAPFITSTLQQAASIGLGFSVKKTMLLAQRLYEAGRITYMRTDSTNISNDAVSALRTFISEKYGSKYLPETVNIYKSKGLAQEAHEAIRPSDVRLMPEQLKILEKEQIKLYELIWKRFVACQMNPAVFTSTTITAAANKYELRATGRVMQFDGWMRVLSPVFKNGNDDIELPDVKEGDEINLIKIDISQHFTKPPARFNEASLVKELEKKGIGRPSTYASIISTIQDRGYVRLEKKRFYAEKMGDVVTERLIEYFEHLLDYNFTANLEKELDAIAQGNMDWQESLNVFYENFQKDLEKASSDMKEKKPTLTNVKCPSCERPMTIRIARTGVFLGCSGYNLPVKERCKSTINLVRGEEVESIEGQDDETTALMTKHRCPKCSTAMDSFLIDENRKLHICGNNPACDGYEVEEGKFRIKGYDGPVITCDKCQADMELKTGRFGKFFGCTNYPECKNTRKLLRNGEPAPPKADPVSMPELKCEKSDGHFILRDGAAGIFLASNLFPKSRETKSPLVEDLHRHRDELDPKFYYLADAPQKDPDGNTYMIRYKRKEKKQYILSEKDGKPTGWKAFYVNNKWVEEKPEKKVRHVKKKTLKK